MSVTVVNKEVVEVTQPVIEANSLPLLNKGSNKEEIIEPSKACEHQAEISIPCQKDCVDILATESQLNQTVTDLKSEQTQSVALLADEPNLSEDISDIDSLCEQEVLSIVDTVFPEKFPIKDSVAVFCQDSYCCDTEAKDHNTNLFPVGPLQSFDYYHLLIAEDLKIIEVMEKVGRLYYCM